MEYTNKKVQVAMAIGLYLAIAVLLLALIVILKNINEIKTDPIVYGIEKHNFMMCSCYDSYGNSQDYNSDGIIAKVPGGFNIDFTNP